MILAAENVSFAFDGFRVLDGVSLEVPQKGIVGLIGPNGAGKSTLFAVISGFEPPLEGAVRIAGSDVTRADPVARARAGLGRTFQVPREFRHLTVRENMLAAAPDQAGERLLDLFFRPGRVRRQERMLRDQADAILEFLSLARVADTPSGLLSGGQKKLLELGRILMMEPAIILLDEPFAGVNPVLISQISDRIRKLNQRGVAFLIVEHNLQALSALVNSLHVMDRGRIIASGAPQSVLADTDVREAYMGGVV